MIWVVILLLGLAGCTPRDQTAPVDRNTEVLFVDDPTGLPVRCYRLASSREISCVRTDGMTRPQRQAGPVPQ